MKCDICIKRMCVFASHGVLPQEQVTGANFYVTLRATAEVDNEAVSNDQLNGVVDYSLLTNIIREEMSLPSKLLENVAYRIATQTLQDCKRIQTVTVRIDKENPPLGIQVEELGIEITLGR